MIGTVYMLIHVNKNECCGYEVRPASAIRTGPAGLRQTWKADILKFADNNTDGFCIKIIKNDPLPSFP